MERRKKKMGKWKREEEEGGIGERRGEGRCKRTRWKKGGKERRKMETIS